MPSVDERCGGEYEIRECKKLKMGAHNHKPSLEEIVNNSIPNRLYWHEFDNNRFFQVVHQDETGFEVKLAPKTMFKVKYLIEKGDIEGFELIKVSHIGIQKLSLSKFNFAQLKAFLSFISEIDLKGISERRLKIADDQELDSDTVRSVKTLLSKNGGAEIVETLIYEGIISSKDIVNISFRKRGLQIFDRLITDAEYWKTYGKENNLSIHSEEKVWQYFFEKNEWIFGYGLDYRFQTILQREACVSDVALDGSNTVIADYLLGNKLFTTFVELKKPSTSLFDKVKNRSNAWCLSVDLFNSVSQILEQKASGLIKLNSLQFDSLGEEIIQKTYDSKVILIIGHWNELSKASNKLESEIKKKTFELYRQDSRNVDIITYDELFDRAKFIVEGKKTKAKNETINDDLPF